MKTELSERESTVLSLAAEGYTDDMIAHELGIEKGTVNSYWIRIRGKMGTYSRSELVARFVRAKAIHELAMEIEKRDHEAASLAEENRALLQKANVEIERLKELLNEKKREA